MKLDATSYGYKAGPPYSKAELEKRNEFIWKNIRYVKIPQIPGRIRILPRKDGEEIFRSVEYIYERSRKKKANAEKGGKTTVSMNKKAIIGSEVGKIVEGWMVPTENYDRFFDADGKPIPQRKEEEEAEEGRETETTEARTAEKASESSKKEDQETEKTDIKAAEDVRIEPKTAGKAQNTTAYPVPVPHKRHTVEKMVMQALEETKKEMLAKERGRLAQIPEDEMTEAEKKTYEHLQNEEKMEQREEAQRRLCILVDMQLHSIEAQTKKNPDDFLSGYKVRKLNQMLAEAQELFRETKYADYLELMPKPITDENGYIVEGITNSDATILLNIYATALHDYSVLF